MRSFRSPSSQRQSSKNFRRFGGHDLTIIMQNKERNLSSMKFMRMALLFFILLAGYAVLPVSAQDLSPFFKDTKGAFVLYDLKNDRYVRYNEARCRERFSPKSTLRRLDSRGNVHRLVRRLSRNQGQRLFLRLQHRRNDLPGNPREAH
jgi:hypothetical protein